MIKNYLLSAIRSFKKSKVSSLINLAGLSIGMASCLLIMIFVRTELSYDQFHEDSDKIFRFYTIDEALGVSSNEVAITEPMMPVAARNEVPEVLQTTRMLVQGRTRVEYDDEAYYAEDTKSIEPGFFDLFDYPLTGSNVRDAFNQPRKAIITRDFAETVFNQEDGIGKNLSIDGDDWEIVGLMEDHPDSHLAFDLILSMYPTQADSGLAQYMEVWGGLGMIGYAKLQDAADEETVESKLQEIATANEVPSFWIPQLQPLEDIHLKSGGILFDGYNENRGEITYVYTLTIVAIIVLLIAAFNFMNLSTAQSTERAKEVGVRKALGAFRTSLINQYLGESILMCLFAGIIAIALVFIIGPSTVIESGTSVLDILIGDPVMLIALIGGILVIGILSGLYPAFVLSNFKTTDILKGKFQGSTKGVGLRKVLVVGQFIASIAMIIGTLFIARQLDFIKNKQLGFNKDQVVTFAMNEGGLSEHAESFKNEVLALENVEKVGGSTNMPGRTFGRTGVRPEGLAEEDDPWIVSAFSFDENYIDVMNMEVVNGRNYNPANTTDGDEAIMVNEAMISQLGWEDPIGKKLFFGSGENRNERTIIGVVKDFHFASMRHSIEPLIMFFNPEVNNNVSLKLKGNISSTMSSLEAIWADLYPDHPFAYEFFDQEFDQLYSSDENFSSLVTNFTWLAIFIACLGLFGLSAHVAEQRRKEVGIRKVLGSSVSQVVMLLSKEFVLLIIVANILAWPLAYYGITRWLGDFQYKINLWAPENLFIYALSALLALAIGLITISYKSISAALINPVKSLRNE